MIRWIQVEREKCKFSWEGSSSNHCQVWPGRESDTSWPRHLSLCSNTSDRPTWLALPTSLWMNRRSRENRAACPAGRRFVLANLANLLTKREKPFFVHPFQSHFVVFQKKRWLVCVGIKKFDPRVNPITNTCSGLPSECSDDVFKIASEPSGNSALVSNFHARDFNRRFWKGTKNTCLSLVYLHHFDSATDKKRQMRGQTSQSIAFQRIYLYVFKYKKNIDYFVRLE